MQGTNKRRSLAVAWLIALAGIAGVAHAAGFDEKLKAPAMKSVVDFKTQAQAFSKRYSDIRAATPDKLVTDASLARQQFDLIWQVQHAIDMRQPLDELAEVGIENIGDGKYRVDMGSHPQWNDPARSFIAVTLPDNLENTLFGLVQRGFRPDDVTTLRKYLDEHDFYRASAAANLAVTLEFARAVKKYDERKQSVPDSLVYSFWYQRMRIQSEGERTWAEGMLKSFDSQRQRILLSLILETRVMSTWSPEDIATGISDLLAQVRSPDFEQRVTAEAKGVAP